MSLGAMTMHKQNNWLWFVELLKNLCIIPPQYVSYYRHPSIQKSRVVSDVFNNLTLFIYLFCNIELFYFSS